MIKAIRKELNHRVGLALAILLVPVIVPTYILTCALIAFFKEIPESATRILPVLWEVRFGIRELLSFRRISR